MVLPVHPLSTSVSAVYCSCASCAGAAFLRVRVVCLCRFVCLCLCVRWRWCGRVRSERDDDPTDFVSVKEKIKVDGSLLVLL